LIKSTTSGIQKKNLLPLLTERQQLLSRPGDTVYILGEYYIDHEVTPVEVPRFGWTIRKVLKNAAEIEYRYRKVNISLKLEIDMKYLKIER